MSGRVQVGGQVISACHPHLKSFVLVEPHHAKRFTGAFVSSSHVCIATVEKAGPERFIKCAVPAVHFELADRDQVSALRLYDMVETYLRDHDVQHLLASALNTTGGANSSYVGGYQAFKIEALLQSLHMVSVDLERTLKVRRWIDETEPLLPTAPAALPAAMRAREQKAYEFAAFASTIERATGAKWPGIGHV